SRFTATETDPFPSRAVLDERDPVLPIEAFPEIESKADFQQRAIKHWNARIRRFYELAADEGVEVEHVQTLPIRHLTWLAENQINRLRNDPVSRMHTAAIARKEGVDPGTVRDGIAAAAQILKFNLRPHKAGRPR